MLCCYAAGKNKQPILDVLKPRLQELQSASQRPVSKLLEIASGTGEHAQLFASSLPNVLYQPSEPMMEMHDSIRAWTEALPHVLPPVCFDILSDDFSLLPTDFTDNSTDVMICINMVHISPFECTLGLFRSASRCLTSDGFLLT
jgi:SAM-dependent methyltransferase